MCGVLYDLRPAPPLHLAVLLLLLSLLYSSPCRCPHHRDSQHHTTPPRTTPPHPTPHHTTPSPNWPHSQKQVTVAEGSRCFPRAKLEERGKTQHRCSLIGPLPGRSVPPPPHHADSAHNLRTQPMPSSRGPAWDPQPPGQWHSFGVVWCVAVWCGVVWCGVVWCGVVWCGVVWCGVVWCGVVWCGVVWCGVVRCGAVRCGVVWCGVVWCGVVWCGVVWCGVPKALLPKGKRPGCLPTGKGKRAGLCVLCARRA